MLDKIEVIVRPLRLAVLPRAGDLTAYRQAIELNTAHWGGIFNPIVSVATAKRSRTVSAGSYPAIESALSRFDPDYIIPIGCNFSSKASHLSERVLSLENALQTGPDRAPRIGIAMSDVLQHWYRRELRFVAKDPVQAATFAGTDKGLDLIVGSAFGILRREADALAFSRALDVEHIAVSESDIVRTYMQPTLSPIAATRFGVQCNPTSRHEPESILLILDPISSEDALDLWNLRACGKSVIPWPSGNDPSELRQLVGHFEANRSRYTNVAARVFRTRSVSDAVQRKIIDLLANLIGGIVHCGELPRPGDPGYSTFVDSSSIEHKSGTRLATIDRTWGLRLSFKPLVPEFARFRGALPCCVNVIGRLPEGNPDIPSGIKHIDRLIHTAADKVRLSRQGLAVLATPFTHCELRLPSRFDVLAAWMKNSDAQIELSDAGKIAASLIDAVGEPSSFHVLASREILELLNNLAHGEIEVDELGANVGSRAGTSRKVRANVIHKDRLFGSLLKINNGDKHVAQNHLDSLCSIGVIKPGLYLQCHHCSQRTWFALDRVSYSLICERCTKSFEFPSSKPPTDWYYRAVGPFSVENFARGAYTVALALGTLVNRAASREAWIPSFKVVGEEIEADFGFLTRSRSRESWRNTVVVFGECKSFNRFEPRDFRRARILFKRFPGAIIAFCTLNDKLSSAEKRGLKSINPWLLKQRKVVRSGSFLVLTGVEQIGLEGLPNCWREKGPPYDQFGNDFDVLNDILALCSTTQKIHLEQNHRLT